MHLEVKNEYRKLTCALGSCHHHPRRGKLIISPGSIFSKICFPPAERLETMMEEGMQLP